MPTAVGLMTFEEFELTPEHAGKQELLNGELIELPPPKKTHSKVAKRFFLLLHAAIEGTDRRTVGPEVGEAFHEMGYRVTRKPDSWLIPDISLTHANQPGDANYYEGAPLLAIEVVSESNTARQIAIKVKLYLSNGSREVWVVYPDEKFVWVHRGSTARLVEDTLETDLIPSLSIHLPSALQ